MTRALLLYAAALITLAAPTLAWAQPTPPAELAASDDWTRRLTAARQLSTSPQPQEALELLTALAADAEVAVALQAYEGLARLAPEREEALLVLTQALQASDAARREGAALALLRSELELDADLRDQATLQITSPDGRDWLDAIRRRGEVQILAAETRAARERHGELLGAPGLDADCASTQHARFNLQPALISEGPRRFQRFWREGRFDAMRDELNRLRQEALALEPLNDALTGQCLNATAGGGDGAGGGGAGGGGGGGGGGGFWASARRPGHEVYIKANAWLGHDNNTFLMRPGLVVTEPGVPERGQPIDLVRDDTLFGLIGQLIWRYGFGDTTLEQDDWRSLFHRGNHWLVRLIGGYNGRLRWGQFMGPTIELDVTYDRFRDWGEGLLSHLRVHARTGLSLPDWEDERDPTTFPGRAVGGALDAAWTLGPEPPGNQPWPLPAFGLRYRGDVYGYNGELGVTPPEDIYSTHRLSAVATAGLGEPAQRRAGGALDLDLRLTDGGLAHALAVSARGALFSYDLVDSRVELELGYAAALPLEGALAVVHSPVGRGDFIWRENGSDLFFEVRLGIERSIRPAGRYGWAATIDEGHAGIRIGGIREVTWFELDIFGERAVYAGTGGQELSAASFLLEIPLLPAEPIITTLRVDGRLAADDARFQGRLIGQLRVMMWVDFSTKNLL